MNNEIVKIECSQPDGEMARMLILEEHTYLDLSKGEWSSAQPQIDFVESQDSVVFQKQRVNSSTVITINGIDITGFMKQTLINFLIESI